MIFSEFVVFIPMQFFGDDKYCTTLFSLFQVFKVQMNPCYLDIHNMNQYFSELVTTSLSAVEGLERQVIAINERWDKLRRDCASREVVFLPLFVFYHSFITLKWNAVHMTIENFFCTIFFLSLSFL